MNINESCLLKFLFNPFELMEMTDIITDNIKEIHTKIETEEEL